MRYREITADLEAINGLEVIGGEANAVLLTFNDCTTDVRADRHVTATILSGDGKVVCSSRGACITEALLMASKDIDPRGMVPNRDPSQLGRQHTILELLSFAVKPEAIAAMTQLKDEIQDEMRRAGKSGDYAKAAALRQKSIGVTKAIQVARTAKSSSTSYQSSNRKEAK